MTPNGSPLREQYKLPERFKIKNETTFPLKDVHARAPKARLSITLDGNALNNALGHDLRSLELDTETKRSRGARGASRSSVMTLDLDSDS